MQPASTTTINLRASADIRDLIDRAASLQGKTRTDFVLEASAEKAKQVLLDQTLFLATALQLKAFERALAEPVGNNRALKKLLASRAPWEV